MLGVPNDISREVVQGDGRRGELVSIAVAKLGLGGQETGKHAGLPYVAWHFFNFQPVEAEVYGVIHSSPKVSVFPFARWLCSFEEQDEGVVYGLVVYEYVDWSFGYGNEMDQGQRFGPLG